jgi:hypothetical protein
MQILTLLAVIILLVVPLALIWCCLNRHEKGPTPR